MLTGKGVYTFLLDQCENGQPAAILHRAQEAGLSHVLIKIADGVQPFNRGMEAAVTQILQANGIQVWGWHFVYGDRPQVEADLAIRRVQELGLDGYVIDAESQYKHKYSQAQTFSQRLRQGLPDTPIALSSFRFPEWHRELPWDEFLSICDIHMPQVYWEMGHNVAWQLEESKRQCDQLPNARPYVPTAPIYGTPGWTPTPQDLETFMQKSRELGIQAVNFFSWDYARAHLPHLWQTMSQLPALQPALPDRWLEALQQHDLQQLSALYAPQAVLQAGTRSYRGESGLKTWYQHLFKELPQTAHLERKAPAVMRPPVAEISWQAVHDNGGTIFPLAHDIFVLDEEGRIRLHYTFYLHADGSSPLLPAPGNGLPQPM